jgi:hypothetical protein
VYSWETEFGDLAGLLGSDVFDGINLDPNPFGFDEGQGPNLGNIFDLPFTQVEGENLFQ